MRDATRSTVLPDGTIEASFKIEVGGPIHYNDVLRAYLNGASEMAGYHFIVPGGQQWSSCSQPVSLADVGKTITARQKLYPSHFPET